MERATTLAAALEREFAKVEGRTRTTRDAVLAFTGREGLAQLERADQGDGA